MYKIKTEVLTAAAISKFAYKDFDKCPTLYLNPDGVILEKKTFFDVKNTEGVVYHNIIDGIVYVAFRGTSSIGDVFTDTNLTVKEYLGIKAHRGFVKSYLLIEKQVEDMISSLIKDPNCVFKKIVICGHSLGGALANLSYHHIHTKFENELKENELELNLVTYGAPKVFSSRHITEELRDNMLKNSIRMTHSDDIVPTLPKYSKFMDKVLHIKYEHIGQHLYIGESDSKEQISEHMINSYIKCLEDSVI